MTSRREFLQGATVAAVPMMAGVSAAAQVPVAPAPAFHAVLIDDRHAEARAFGAVLAGRGASVHAVPDGDVTALWLRTIAPAWRLSPVAVAGLTRPAVLFCLEQLAWSNGLRVVFHAEHVVTRAGLARHAVHRPSHAAVALQAQDLLLRGPLWPGYVADVVASLGTLTSHAPAGPSCAGLAPPLPADAELLTSWIIAPV